MTACLSYPNLTHHTLHATAFPPLLALFCALSLSSIVSAQSEQRPQILVETTKGNFIIELFNETPVHRDNYLKLVRQHAFDGVQFHRVIKDFMIQAGNLKTRGLSREKSLPSDSDEATIKAETMPEKFVHVRGYIGAAREGDDTNPEKKSILQPVLYRHGEVLYRHGSGRDGSWSLVEVHARAARSLQAPGRCSTSGWRIYSLWSPARWLGHCR